LGGAVDPWLRAHPRLEVLKKVKDPAALDEFRSGPRRAHHRQSFQRTTAEEFIAKARQDSREGRLNLPKRRKVALTLATAAPLYLDRLLQEGGKNIECKRLQLEQSLIPYFGSHPLSRVTTFDVERYKKHRAGQSIRSRKKLNPGETDPSVRPSTINRELATLSHLLNLAAEWGWIERPTVNIRKLKEGTGRIVYLTTEQADALLEAAKGDQNRQIYPFVLIGLRTGMRKSEILSIRREHIDLAARSIYVPHAKAGARAQPISQDVSDFLSAYMKTLPPGSPWLFPSVGTPGMAILLLRGRCCTTSTT
jgi:integrase